MSKLSSRRAVNLAVVIVVAGVFVGLPLYTQTSNFPLAIVQGNSMYPTLHNGDLILFGRAPQGMIKNGTIIVFVQGDTGVSSLDSIIRPVVIHRIVGYVVQADGTVYYRTKGDNNQFVDPSLTEANHVLGVPIEMVPSVGVIVLFFESSQGLVTVIGSVSMYYVGKYEVSAKDEKKRNQLLGDLTKLVFERDIPNEQMRRIELAVKYGKTSQISGQGDSLLPTLLAWVKGGALEKGWVVERKECPKCSSAATLFVSSKNNIFTVCRNCMHKIEERTRAQAGGVMPTPTGAVRLEVPLQKVYGKAGDWKSG